MVKDPYQALLDLEELSFQRVLTSGCENTVLEGIELIAELIEKSKQQQMKIIIMLGGGINESNITKIAQITKAREFHTSGKKTFPSLMQYQNNRVSFFGATKPSEFHLSVVDADRVQNFVNMTKLL